MDRKPLVVAAQDDAAAALRMTLNDLAAQDDVHLVRHTNALFESFCDCVVRDEECAALHAVSDIRELHDRGR